MQRVAEEIAAAPPMGADPHVVEHRHPREQGEVLERAADADLDDPVRGLVEDAASLEQNIAAPGRVEPAEAIEQRGLAGAVGPDQAEHLPRRKLERHAVERDDAAEADADVLDFQQRLGKPSAGTDPGLEGGAGHGRVRRHGAAAVGQNAARRRRRVPVRRDRPMPAFPIQTMPSGLSAVRAGFHVPIKDRRRGPRFPAHPSRMGTATHD